MEEKERLEEVGENGMHSNLDTYTVTLYGYGASY